MLDRQAVQSSYGCSTESLSSLRLKRSSATENLHQSRQGLRSWAAAFKAESNSLNSDLSEYSRLLKTFSECVDNLEKKNQQLSLQLEHMHQGSARSHERASQPKTLRGIISVRIMETAEKSNINLEPDHTPIAESESLDPIPADILDVALSSDQLDVVEELLPKISGVKSRQIYRGLWIHTCAFCRMPKFQVIENDVCPLFRNFAEFPLQDPYREDTKSYGEICSSCLFKIFLRDICRNWWQDIGALTWLRPRCSFGCCVDDSITCINGVREYLSQFRSLDPADKEKCLSLYGVSLLYLRRISLLS